MYILTMLEQTQVTGGCTIDGEGCIPAFYGDSVVYNYYYYNNRTNYNNYYNSNDATLINMNIVDPIISGA